MKECWQSSAAGWVANERLFDAVFAPITAAILEAAAIDPTDRVLDIGCGTGTLLAAAVDRGASAVGADISPPMVEAARRRVPEATVVVADVQSVPLLDAAPGDPFTLVVSRFGVMFFSDPVAAFANVRAACAPGARLAFACWRSVTENKMFTAGTSVFAARLAPDPVIPTDDAPGPTGLADPARLHGILDDAGWDGVDVTALGVAFDFGFDGTDGVEERMAMLLSTTTGRAARARLEPTLGAAGWDALVEEVRADVRTNLVDGRVQFDGAIWIVTATNPA
jgi:SAM-dependent methyltransferase